MPEFITIAAFIGLFFLIWDCIEVGRNDAVNIVNAVFGARVMNRRNAVYLAGLAVILGASFSAPVMETARKGIFHPGDLTVQKALAIYISVYFVDTVLLYGFSGFGMPVSTTASLVFELVGASLFLAGIDNVNTSKVGTVVLGIVVSITVSGMASFLVMRVFRGAIRDRTQDQQTLLLHGPWIAGVLLTGLTWFMVFKGLKNVEAIKFVKNQVFQEYGEGLILLVLWGAFTLLVHLVLVALHDRGSRYLLHATAILGMVCLGFAFGQNDLANAASPGLAGFTLWRNSADASALANPTVPIPVWALTGCGILMALGMCTPYAQRVTRATVNAGSQFDHVALYAPGWCRSLARFFLRYRGEIPSLAPEPELSEAGKKIHFDALRASVITAISASVIAFASGRGLPVSTTYVSFAAVLGTGISDRVYSRGDADLKLGRAIWIITCWFLAPLFAIVATGTVALLVFHLTTGGIFLAIFLNFAVRFLFKRRSDAHERKYHESTSSESPELENAPDGNGE